MAQSTRLIAVRHGETAWNVATRIQGQLDIGLNATGVWQAEQAAIALQGEPIDVVIASDLWRAWQTAQIIASAQNLSVTTDEALRERGFGEFEGKTYAEIAAQFPDQSLKWRKRVPDFAPDGGESLNAFRERVVAVLTRLCKQHVGKTILVVAHGGVMDVLYRAAARLELQAPRTWALDNASLNRVLWSESGGFFATGWNDTQHLDSKTPPLGEVSA